MGKKEKERAEEEARLNAELIELLRKKQSRFPGVRHGPGWNWIQEKDEN